MQSNNRRALIFGISGQDGAYLADLLLRKGIEVHGTSRDKESAGFSNLRALQILDKVTLHSTVLGDFRSVVTTLRTFSRATSTIWRRNPRLGCRSTNRSRPSTASCTVRST